MTTEESPKQIQWFKCCGPVMPEWVLFVSSDWANSAAMARNAMYEAAGAKRHRINHRINLATNLFIDYMIRNRADVEHAILKATYPNYLDVLSAAKSANGLPDSASGMDLYPDAHMATTRILADIVFNGMMGDEAAIDPIHRDIIRQSAEVYRRGYALCAEVDGRLFVYGKE